VDEGVLKIVRYRKKSDRPATDVFNFAKENKVEKALRVWEKETTQ
jgi:hypothetical protein